MYVKRWKLKLNPLKTESVFFTKRRALRAFPRREIKVNGHPVPWSDSAKYLGVILDKKLTFKKHIDYAIEKSGKGLKILYSLLCRKSKLQQTNKLLVYKSVLRPILLYAAPAWKGCAKSHLKRLQVFQNKSLKMCLNLELRHPTTSVHEKANIKYIKQSAEEITTKLLHQSSYSNNPLLHELQPG